MAATAARMVSGVPPVTITPSSGAAQFTLVEAARSVPASVLGTVEYAALIWSFVFGYLFFGELPAATVYIGAFLVVAAGLTLALSERRNRREIIDTP